MKTKYLVLFTMPIWLLPSCQREVDIFEKTSDTTTRFWIGEEILRQDAEKFPNFSERHSWIYFDDPDYFLPAGLDVEEVEYFPRVAYVACRIEGPDFVYRIDEISIYNTQEVSIYGLKVGDYKDDVAKQLYPLGFYYYNSYNIDYIFWKDGLGMKVTLRSLHAAYWDTFPGEILPIHSDDSRGEKI